MKTKNYKRSRRSRRSKKTTNSRNTVNFSVLLLVCSLFIGGVSYAAVGANLGAIISTTLTNAIAMIQSQVAEAAKTMAEQAKTIGTFSMNTIKNITLNTNTMMGNLKIATAQNAQSSQALAEVQIQTAQKAATARQTIHMQDQLIKTMRKYGPQGQGFKACVVVAENKGLDSANQQSQALAAAKETETLRAIMPKASLSTTVNEKLKLSDSEFCAAGNPACTPSSLPGGNVNGALLFSAASPGSKEQLARQQFRENVVGVNVQSLTSPSQINSPNGQKAFFESNRQAALLSPAAYSLAHIDAQNTKTITRDGKQYSAKELIDQTINRYYGGEEAKEWQSAMLVQEPRGLLVESARLSGVSVWLNNYMYQQNLRKEANLASILLATSTPLADDVREYGNKVEARAIRSITPVYR